jgi:chromosomal replication initiator protein
VTGDIWDQVLTRIENKVNRHSFYTWFKPTTFVADRSGELLVRVPNAVFRDWLGKHYAGIIAEALGELGEVRVVQFVTEIASEPQIPNVTPAELEHAADFVPAPITGSSGLNSRYTFDTFIVGSSNQFAHAAARAVAEAPSRSYNPLFVYGGVGLGKTHLMHAIGRYVLEHFAGAKLTYISAERFMNEMINAMRYDRSMDFRERYRSVDVLLVDDIQFIAGKDGTQNEFFHTFNALHDAQ